MGMSNSVVIEENNAVISQRTEIELLSSTEIPLQGIP